MKNSEKAETIVKLVQNHLREAMASRIRAQSELAGAEEGYRRWKMENEPGFSVVLGLGKESATAKISFAVVEFKKKILENHLKTEQEWNEIHDYAIKVFLSKIPDEG